MFKFRIACHKPAAPRLQYDRLKDPVVKLAFDQHYTAARTIPADWEELAPEAAAAALHGSIAAASKAAAEANLKKSPAIKGDLGKGTAKRWERSDRTKALFEYRAADLQALVRGSAEWRAVRMRYRNQIVHSCRQDYRDWVEEAAEGLDKAAQAGNAKAVWDGVRKLGGKRGDGYKQPTKTRDGTTDLRDEQELLAEWKGFAEAKYACTAR
jgi:hypothetical protein